MRTPVRPASPLLARLLGLYLLLALGLPLLRLARCWPVAATGWGWVTAPLWLPWGLALGSGLWWLLRHRRPC